MMLYLVVPIGFVLLIDLLLIIIWVTTSSQSHSNSDSLKYPAVSILIAARNEEANISACLKALLNQEYPTDKLEIIVGDDGSTDKTYKMAKSLLSEKANAKIIQIEKPIAHLKGKANVLAQLAKNATGEYLFITDADIIVPKTWISSMLAGKTDDVGIVTGVTAVSNNNWQNLDWTFALGMVTVLHNLGKPVTTMGNNMMVTKEAYNAVGGYESIPFSITEDLELFKQVNEKGFKVMQLYRPEVLAYTAPVKSFWKLLHQRKRWMKGAVQLPFSIVFLLFAQAIYLPLLVTLAFVNLEITGVIILIKILLQAIFIHLCLKATQQKTPWSHLIFYEFYAWCVTLFSSIFYLLPFRVSWKGRKY